MLIPFRAALRAALLLGVFVLPLAPCGKAPADPPSLAVAAADIRPVNALAPRSRARLRIGETLRLRFDASPATGYRWSFLGRSRRR